jgi:ABC-type Fe3+-hydroxamate transport system substrate-binding protein
MIEVTGTAARSCIAMRRSLSAGITAGALVAIALTGCGTTSHAQPNPTVTKTSVRIVTKTVTKTVKVPEPGPTVTVTVNGDAAQLQADKAQLQADNTCIDALYQNIQGWKASGIVPNGWWDARCPTP